ncbi:MAG: hypothetical protein NTX61_02195 [Bacteroidetes bacterium]|nr:hypothetical protein [Bacteroidota bacterium]
MENLNNELLKFTQIDGRSNYAQYHKLLSPPLGQVDDPNYATKTSSLLVNFLNASIDEVRLRHAQVYSKRILGKIDIDDADHFREGVLKREIAGKIMYTEHRDHEAHTLYNYIMGWYILSNNTTLQKELFSAFDQRFGKWDKGNEWQSFGNIWPFTSLLHDIGYLLEGSIDPLEISLQTDLIQSGAAVIKEYFYRKFWQVNGIGATPEREIMRKITNVIEPQFSNESMSSLADTLRNLGTLEHLRNVLLKGYNAKGISPPSLIMMPNGLMGDSFRLWAAHYAEYDKTNTMIPRIKEIEDSFYSNIWEGMPNSGIRVLDHGVCSGLILLLYSTFYFRMFFALDAPPDDPIDAKIWNVFTGDMIPENVEYKLYWWWNSIVWATGATAIHNFQQQTRPWRELGSDCGRLKMDQDPLAYLGILVDTLQEWNRYTVKRKTAIVGSLPIQGHDISLGTKNNHIIITYPEGSISARIRNSLDTSLDSWEKIVRVKP